MSATEAEIACGFAAASWTGSSQHIGIFEIDGSRMRATGFSGGAVIKWGYCNRQSLLSPILPTIDAVRAHLAAQDKEQDA